MGQYKISKAGNLSGGCSGIPDALRAVAQTQARIFLTGKMAVTDNSGGVADVGRRILFPSAIFDGPANGNDRATGANVDAALSAILNALTTLFVVAVGGANLIGSEAPLVALGGTNGNGTIGAISTAVAGAATGPSAAIMTPTMALINVALHELACVVKHLEVAAGTNELILDVSSANKTYGLGPNFPGATVAGVITNKPAPPNDVDEGSTYNSAIDFGLGPNFPGAVVNGVVTNQSLGPFTGTPGRKTVAGFPVASGPVAATGLAASDVNAVLSVYVNNIATISAALNALNLPGILGLRASS